MNPFMMSNIFFGPMGMSVSPMCCGGVNMPYYGQYDMLTFMNFPIFRNTSSDYLLDPRLAMMQCQQNMMNGGSIFGNNYLPLFNNFPGVGGFGFPWGNPGVKPETDEEKKAREAKEAEAKKPDAKKAAALKKTFDNIVKLAEDKKNRFPKIPEELAEKAKKAMEKETAKEQLDAMKEVMASIPAETLRKTVLADEEIKKQLREAGYNFNLLGNKYSLKDEVAETDITHEKRLTAIRNDIESSMYQYSEFQYMASQLNSTTILPFISAWNSKNNTKILDLIADNIPAGNDAVKLKSAQDNVVKLVRTLLEKADEYDGYPEITKIKKSLSEKLNTITSPDNASIEDRQKVFTKENITEISKTFNQLYARLRMQEAVKIRDAIKANDEFIALNEIKDDVINDDMIVEETMKDLEGEGITNYPSVEALDKAPVTEEIKITSEIEADDADEEYKDDKQALVDEFLVKKKGVLSKVDNSNVYQTKAYDEETGKGIRYYQVKDNKLTEVKKTEDGKFVPVAGSKEATAKDIVAYDAAITRLSNLLENNVLEPVEGQNNLFKATGADEYYALIDNKFGKVKTSADSITVDELTADNLEEFNDADVKSAEKVKEDKKAEEEKDVAAVAKKVYASVNEIDYDALVELNKITGVENDFEETPVKGYFYCNSKKRYYVYNQQTGKLDYLRGVTKITDTGYMLKDNKLVPCSEIINVNKFPAGSDEYKAAIQEYAKAFAKDLNGATSDAEYVDAKRRLNTFTSFTNKDDIINFVKGYKAYGGFWSNSGMCKQIATENGLKEGNSHTDIGSKRYFIKTIAEKFKGLVKSSADKQLLDQIARGELLSAYSLSASGTGAVTTSTAEKSIRATAEALDKIIDKVLEAYD